MFLYHYYDKKIGPFMNLSELSIDEANVVLSKIKKKNRTYSVLMKFRIYV